MKNRYLQYKDQIITIFDDYSKMLSVLVNDCGSTRVINFENWATQLEDYIVAYQVLAIDSFKGCRKNKVLTNDDWQEVINFTKKYIKHIRRTCGNPIDYDYLKESGVIL